MNKFKGKHYTELNTPCIVIDYDNLNRNITTMQAQVDKHNVKFRPHIKTHKCPAIAKMQMAAGAVGITTSTIGETEVMAAAGFDDILLANQVVTADKLDRLAKLPIDVPFVIDSKNGVEAAEKAAQSAGKILKVLIDIDTGYGRCRCRTPKDSGKIAELITDSPNLELIGVQAYNGANAFIQNPEKREEACLASGEKIKVHIKAIEKYKKIDYITGGGTGNMIDMSEHNLLNELQSGSYVFTDTSYLDIAPQFTPALYVLSTVISRHDDGTIIMDAGHKRIGMDLGDPHIYGYEDALQIDHFSEEHMIVKAADNLPSTDNNLPTVGDKLLVIPSHCCPTCNLYRESYVIKDEIIIDRWEITAF